MIRLASSFLLALAILTGCAERAPEPAAPAPPGLDQIRADLVGERFVFFEDAGGERVWTIEASEIRDVQLVDTVRAGDPSRLRVLSRVVLAAPSRTIQGELRLSYLHDGAAWQLLEVERAGPNFVAGDDRFVLFDVSPTQDDTLGRSRGLSLDVIARYDDGAFVAPFEGVEGRIRAFVDSAFASDSLRQLAEAELAEAIAAPFVRRGTAARVLRPGEAPESVRVRDVQVGVEGCRYLNARAPGAQSLGQDAALATTSTVVGGARAPGRALTASERRQLDALARDRLRVQGVGTDRVRSGGSLAIDLDGDGGDDWIGAFAVGSEEAGTARGIVIGARPQPGGAPEFLFERMTAPGFGSFTLVGAVDLDADRAAEVVLLEQGYEVYQYLILTHRAGRFGTAFRGGGGGC